ncbi:MAG: glycoside hydrolase family 99-like domain-containing protein [Pirellulaceae bacterium]
MKQCVSKSITGSLLLGIVCFCHTNTYSFENQAAVAALAPTVGAIRWDAWMPKSGVNSTVGAEVARTLGPKQYHFRLPYYSIIIDDKTVDFPSQSQALMDAEIAYATYAGLNYWAYVFYDNNSVMDLALDFHLTSTRKDDIKWCYIIEQGRLTSSTIPQMVSRIKLSNYQTVNGGQPLFYLFDSSKWTTTQIDSLRTAATNAGLPQLYIVYMGWSGSGAASQCDKLGCQAISAYCTSGSDGQTYKSLADSECSKWNEWKNTGKKVVPIVTTGWDNRPRIDNPVPWTTPPANSWAQTATAAEIAAHLAEAINWTANNHTTNEVNALLIYSWNEHDEGGWLCPTVKVDANNNVLKDSQGGNQVNTDRIEALRNVLKPGIIPTSESPGARNTTK